MHDITYTPEKRKGDEVRKIVIAAPWIAFIATAVSQRKEYGGLLSENTGDLKRWAKKLDSVFNSFLDKEKLHDEILQDFKSLPTESKAKEFIARKLISDQTWMEKVLPYLGFTSHSRNKNIETQSNYSSNPILPIIRDYKYMVAFFNLLQTRKGKQQ